MNIKLVIAALVTLLASACSSVQHQSQNQNFVSLESFPSWFKDSVSREQELTTTSPLKIPQLNIDTEVSGSIKLIEEDSSSLYFQIEIGTKAPVECYVLQEYDGAANSLHALIDSSLSGIEEANNLPLSETYNYAINTGVISGTPFLRFDTLYSLGTGNEKAAGILKGASAETNDSLQICLHNELGYHDTFSTVFNSFINAFSQSEQGTDFYRTIYELTLNDKAVGYAREKYTVDSDGDIQIEYDSASLIPLDATSVARSDSASISWSRPNGSLINKKEHSIENGALASAFSLYEDNGKWLVEGELQGKAINAELNHTDWLLSDYGSYLASADLMTSDEKSAEYNIWSSDADPTAVLKLILSKIDNNPSSNMKMDIGPLSMDAQVEKNGVAKKVTFKQGAMNMLFEQTFANGEPLLR